MRVYFCSNQNVQSSVTVYMKNLVAADFFLCLCLPLRIAAYANNSEIMSNIYCSFGATAFYINMYASILFMDFIAANRYLKIVQPVEAHALQTVHTAYYISAAIWLSLLAMASIYLTLFLQNFWGQMPDAFTCESRHSSQLSVTYKIIHCVTFVGFIVVLVSLILLYWKTHQKLRQVQFSSQVSFRSQTFKRIKDRKEALRHLVTPPHSPQLSPEQAVHPQPSTYRQHNQGRRRSRKTRKKLHKQIEELKILLKKQTKKNRKVQETTPAH
ncbi:hypothetical protein G5714_014784 [Onychostoma macrolepis]|uniref:G-protein coupled receptors family 1 profile domain-containing protein n=1 Tax=Onychostoma macrolepis TaxID=369639 RepID=A0A7J6C912_9TELE|nr:hypothetical protein G5714_014784 [Onychostoma macrolepis]